MKLTFCCFVYNTTFPITIQYKQLLKHIKQKFDYIIFTDSTNEELIKLQDIVNTLNHINNVQLIHIDSPHVDGSQSLGYCLNFATKYLFERRYDYEYEIVVYLHGDIFPYQDIDIQQLLENYHIASTIETRILDSKTYMYLYPCLTVININKIDVDLLDFRCDVGLDTGGLSYKYIYNYPNNIKVLIYNDITYYNINDDLKAYFKKIISICDQYQINSVGWLSNGFYHFVAGSAWNMQNKNCSTGFQTKIDLCKEYFN